MLKGVIYNRDFLLDIYYLKKFKVKEAYRCSFWIILWCINITYVDTLTILYNLPILCYKWGKKSTNSVKKPVKD